MKIVGIVCLFFLQTFRYPPVSFFVFIPKQFRWIKCYLSCSHFWTVSISKFISNVYAEKQYCWIISRLHSEHVIKNHTKCTLSEKQKETKTKTKQKASCTVQGAGSFSFSCFSSCQPKLLLHMPPFSYFLSPAFFLSLLFIM